METAKWGKVRKNRAAGRREEEMGRERKNGEKLGGKENGKWPGERGERKEEGEQEIKSINMTALSTKLLDVCISLVTTRLTVCCIYRNCTENRGCYYSSQFPRNIEHMESHCLVYAPWQNSLLMKVQKKVYNHTYW